MAPSGAVRRGFFGRGLAESDRSDESDGSDLSDLSDPSDPSDFPGFPDFPDDAARLPKTKPKASARRAEAFGMLRLWGRGCPAAPAETPGVTFSG